jgi:hypothetical protein
MKRASSFWGKHRFAIISMVFLFLSFSINIFGLGDSPRWFYEFQKDSSFLVEKVSLCKGEQRYYSGILNYSSIETRGSTSCKEQDNVPYAPQFGLQARTISFFSPGDKERLSGYFSLVSITLAALSALVVALIVLRTRQLFGTTPAVALLIGACLSPWLAVYAHNMYWIFVVSIAPFATVYCYYPWFKQRKLIWLMYAAIFLILLMKLLSGYEHIVTIVFSVMAGLTLYEYRGFRKTWGRLLVKYLTVGIVAVLAFVCAIGINVVGLNEYYGTTEKSITAIRGRADARGIEQITKLQPDVLVGLEYTLPDVYQALEQYMGISQLRDGKAHPAYYAVLSTLNYGLLPALNYPVRSTGILWTILQSIGFLAILGFIASIKVAQQKKQRDYSSLAAMVVSLLGALGWLVLMPGHTYPHAHLNAIVFYLPFLLLCYIEIGRYAAILIDRIKLHATTK